MVREIVAIASLGGTITMTASPQGSTGVRPTLNALDLIEAVPEISRHVDVSAETLATIPGASLSVADLLRALAWAEEAVAAGAVGVVLIQGTDTIEESAYLLDLYWRHEAPLVVTGAMRSAQTAGADGPANVLAAVQVAACFQSRSRGVLVVMNDQIHASSRVRKGRSSGPDAFWSPSFGPLGYVVESQAVFGGTISRPQALAVPPSDALAPVAIVETYLGDDGALLDLAAAANFEGIVLDAFGVGHVAQDVAETVSKVVAKSTPVVLTTRTGSGPTFTSTYGFIGSETDLNRRGAIPAGWLDARKSRILLAAMLSVGSDIDEISAEFQRRGTLTAAAPTD
ncbi:asparaginase [Nocardioides endophyticus]|uniref:Asparaginase n=1 Tax=Nocardioides endophyticus TaxID=1353775 RepID=A0ABP8YM05_9ACTN